VVHSADDSANNSNDRSNDRSNNRRMDPPRSWSTPAGSPGPASDALSWAFQFADLCGIDLFLVDPESGRFLDCNASALQTLGYSRGEILAMGPAQLQADDHHDPVWVTQRLRQLLKEGRGSFPTRHRRRDGTAVDVRVNLITVNPNGRPVVVSLVETIRNAQPPNPHLDQQLLLFQETEAIHGAAGWHHQLHCGTMGWTPQVERIAGCTPADFPAYLELVHPDDRQQLRQAYRQGVERREQLNLPHRLRLSSGEVRQVLITGLPRCDDAGNPCSVLGTLTDTTSHLSRLQDAERSRLQDPLTELPNKTATLEWLGKQLCGRPYNANLSVLSLDIDGFQEINDTFGHETGDQLLCSYAKLLSRDLAGNAWVARLASDEFCVVFHQGVNSFGEAIQRARELQLRLHALDTLTPELPLRPTVSMGVSCFPEHSNIPSALLQCANTALMEAKRQGRAQLRAYSTTISRQIRERLVLDGALHKAISREQLRILVQPQSDRNGQLCGGEVLLRWRDHHGSDVSPAFFIPLAEQSGLIFPLTNWVLQATLELIRQWRLQKLVVPRLGINISTRLLESFDRNLPDQLRTALADHQLTADAVELEITETALLRNPVAAAETVRHLAHDGFQIAIDDFGTGYSSLDLLRSLPVHKLKIDTTFIRNLEHSPEDRAIVAATITLAHGLGMACIAEGVETESQREILLDLGCDQFQGYLCGRPTAIAQFGQLLAGEELPCVPALLGRADSSTSPAADLGNKMRLRATSFDELDALRSAFEASLDAFLLAQAVYGHTGEIIDFTVLEANNAACKAMLQTREGVVGQTLCTLVPAIVTTGLLEHYATCLQRSIPLELDDFPFQKPEGTGETQIYDLRAYPSQHLLTITWRDVTLRSQRTRSLAESADLLELLARNLPETLVVLDDQQQIRWVSASLEQLTGWRGEQWLGRPFSDLFSTPTAVPEPLPLNDWLRHPGDTGQRRLRLTNPRGGWSWVTVSGRRLNRNSGEHGYVLTLHTSAERPGPGWEASGEAIGGS
jgi:diguanylate cyclase (GGDEF)-like protein/PAS domain S-box-containing protein